ncbi:bifunctional nuclease family protein [bacterium]|nr:bifunctional nuclease family protein [candidate division CSSED10-310 bacterium]
MEKMTIRNLAMDPILERPIVLLTNKSGDKVVPIWVGIFEANAILIELEKLKAPRPITHDLMKNILLELKARLKRVIVTDLKDGVYFAVMEIVHEDRKIVIDSRPSDAIAMALRFKAPIYVTNDVLEKSSSADHGAEMVEDDEMRKWIDQLKPGDFEDLSSD